MYYIIPILQKDDFDSSSPKYNQSFFDCFKIFYPMKSQVPFKKNPNMENY